MILRPPICVRLRRHYRDIISYVKAWRRLNRKD